MSAKMTRIRLKKSLIPENFGGGSFGLMEWDEQTFEHMMQEIRRKAYHDKKVAELILAANAEDFEVAVVRGPWAQHHIKDIFPQDQK